MQVKTAKLRDITYRKGLTQTKVAKLIGVSRATVNTIYNGKSATEETIQKLADLLGIPVEKIRVE